MQVCAISDSGLKQNQEGPEMLLDVVTEGDTFNLELWHSLHDLQNRVYKDMF
jgi:hypothetical protein